MDNVRAALSQDDGRRRVTLNRSGLPWISSRRPIRRLAPGKGGGIQVSQVRGRGRKMREPARATETEGARAGFFLRCPATGFASRCRPFTIRCGRRSDKQLIGIFNFLFVSLLNYFVASTVPNYEKTVDVGGELGNAMRYRGKQFDEGNFKKSMKDDSTRLIC